MSANSSYDIKMLLKQVGEGDEQSFRLIFDHYKGPFHAAAFKMTRSADISREIVQEVFVTLWIKRKFVAAAKRPQSYIFTILHNCIYLHFRKVARERQLKFRLEQKSEEAENLTEILLIEKENKAILENVISRMPPQQRLVYKLAKQEGLTRDQIAHSLNVSPHTVKNHLGAAVEFLQGYFKKGASSVIWAVIWTHL